ncbi:sensor histidine kinase [Flavobacterium sp. 3-218]
MIFSPILSIKKHFLALCIMGLLLFGNTGMGQENQNLLSPKLTTSEIDAQQTALYKNILVGFLFLLLLYSAFRLKKKKNEEIEIQRQQIAELNELNKKLLTEKEWLLREIHHRVKNNLQIVISLLNAQSAYLHNEDALMAIKNSQHRMHAMSLIHQKLYQSDNLANINMDWYVHELINCMKDCFRTAEKINFILEVEKTYLDVAQAVPIGLIINEAVSNAIKYAFPDDRKGKIGIIFQNIGEKNYRLQISDNGIGLSQKLENIERNSLGMNLIIGLTDQIDGTFNMKNDNGLKITITFTGKTEFDETAENS